MAFHCLLHTTATATTPTLVNLNPLISTSLPSIKFAQPMRTTTAKTRAIRANSTASPMGSSGTIAYPDPIPEFAISETSKFKAELKKKLYKDKDKFGDDLDAVVNVCSQIFSKFLHEEYGGPGTLLVEPFTDMFIALKQNNLPGASLAARASLLWAQNYVDQDWEFWNSNPSN